MASSASPAAHCGVNTATSSSKKTRWRPSNAKLKAIRDQWVTPRWRHNIFLGQLSPCSIELATFSYQWILQEVELFSPSWNLCLVRRLDYCETREVTQSNENPFFQASHCVFVPDPLRWRQISVLWGNSGSCYCPITKVCSAASSMKLRAHTRPLPVHGRRELAWSFFFFSTLMMQWSFS